MKARRARTIGMFEAVRVAQKGHAYGAAYSAREASSVAVSTVEAILQSILLSFFAHDDPEIDQVFNRTLRNVSDRIDIAYCVGLISKEFAEELRILASIRNVFAHDITAMLFTAEQVVPKLEKLGISVATSRWQEAHEAFNEQVRTILSRLLQLCLQVWASGNGLTPISTASDQEWDRVMRTPLRGTGVLCDEDSRTLMEVGIADVEDLFSGRHSFFLEQLGKDLGSVLHDVAGWIMKELENST